MFVLKTKLPFSIYQAFSYVKENSINSAIANGASVRDVTRMVNERAV